MARSASLVVCVVLVLAATRAAVAEDFVPGRTHLVDKFTPSGAPQNLFFRGNNPKVNGAFAYSELVATMKQVRPHGRAVQGARKQRALDPPLATRSPHHALLTAATPLCCTCADRWLPTPR